MSCFRVSATGMSTPEQSANTLNQILSRITDQLPGNIFDLAKDDGNIILGDGEDWAVLSAFTSSTGTLKHESGGLEFDASDVVLGDFIVGTGTGTMGLVDSFSFNLILDNDVYLQGKEVGGTARNLIGVNTSDQIALGASTNDILLNSPTITSGTLTTDKPIQLTQTWNAVGVTFTGFEVDITDTASATGSNLAAFGVGGSALYSFLNDSTNPRLTLHGSSDVGLEEVSDELVFRNSGRKAAMSTGAFRVGSAMSIGWSTAADGGSASSPQMWRRVENSIPYVELRNDDTGGFSRQRQGFSIFGDWVDSSNWARLELAMAGTTSASAFRIYSRVLGTATQRDLRIGTAAGSAELFLDANATSLWGLDSSGTLYPVAASAYDFGKTDRYVANAYIQNVRSNNLVRVQGDGVAVQISDTGLTATEQAWSIEPNQTSHALEFWARADDFTGGEKFMTVSRTGATVDSVSFGGDLSSGSVAFTGGAINGTVVGGSTAAAGTFTNLTSTGNTSLGDQSTDTLSIAPDAVTWSNDPTHSGDHIFSGDVTVQGTFTASSVSPAQIAARVSLNI